MSHSNRDTMFSTPRDGVKPFSFDADVAAVFDDMIGRSVPFYAEIQRATAIIAGRIVPEGGTVYDLGCSTGTTLVLLAQSLRNRDVRLVGIDNSPEMLERCREKLTRSACSAELLLEDLRTFKPDPCSLVVLNYTLQFLAPDERLPVLARLCSSLLPGGALLLSEKVRHRDQRMQTLLDETHLDFKRAHGYSELEIRQKRDAIENVLVPLTLEENVALLEAAGFASVELFAKCINFATVVCLRS